MHINLHFLTASGKPLLHAAVSGLATGVALAAQVGNPIGSATIAAIDAAEATGKTGAEKKADVVAAVAPIVISEAAKGGTAVVQRDAETFAGIVAEEALASVKQTPVVMIGTAIVKALAPAA